MAEIYQLLHPAPSEQPRMGQWLHAGQPLVVGPGACLHFVADTEDNRTVVRGRLAFAGRDGHVRVMGVDLGAGGMAGLEALLGIRIVPRAVRLGPDGRIRALYLVFVLAAGAAGDHSHEAERR
ncbi:MAG: hypothetical protein ACLFRB_06720 [Thiohalorhabdus sp.]|uniref:hypothetical protein n=1 Tax=Thiohalorhabdus sp. TaxID=3094134 RepID=UPI003980BF0D